MDVRRFLDDNGKVKTWPKKHADKSLVLAYLVEKFVAEKTYTEKEVNEVLKEWHTFEDWPLLRRSLIDAGLMLRDRNGYAYRRT